MPSIATREEMKNVVTQHIFTESFEKKTNPEPGWKIASKSTLNFFVLSREIEINQFYDRIIM